MFRSHRSSDEDRKPWHELGCEYEQQFVDRVAPSLFLDAYINPEKSGNPTVPDLVVNGTLSELKVRTRPFFMAQNKYGIDPQYCVMFNKKDFGYYQRVYPNLLIYWWVWWEETQRTIGSRTYNVRPMEGVWRASFGDIASQCKTGIFGQARWGDGCDSFALNLWDFTCLNLILN